MLTQGLYDYLIDTRELTGWPAERFAEPRRVSEINLYTPNDARRLLQDRIERANVFDSRRPQGSTWGTAITLRELFEDTEYGLAGELPGQSSGLELTVYGRGPNASSRVNAAARLARLCLSGFHTGYWGNLFVEECLIRGGDMAPREPLDASDSWEYEQSLELEVMYQSNGPIFPHSPLYGDVSFLDAINVGPDLRLMAIIYPATGRPVVDIKWDIRLGSHTSAVVVTINGAPEANIVTANISGMYKAPSFLRSAFGLNAAAYVTMTLTDEVGTAFTIQVSQ